MERGWHLGEVVGAAEAEVLRGEAVAGSRNRSMPAVGKGTALSRVNSQLRDKMALMTKEEILRLTSLAACAG